MQFVLFPTLNTENYETQIGWLYASVIQTVSDRVRGSGAVDPMSLVACESLLLDGDDNAIAFQ